MEYLHDSLRAQHDQSVLQLLVCERNSGRNTYDGIETGGERVAKEIEDTIEHFARNGVTITKISIVGYSLGGLISRYAIGLLYSKGYFQKIKPVNFTTFATPHLGVRTPLLGWHNHIWNVLGARTLSVSGRQLFMIDKFRGTSRPLLSVLADKDSVFYKGLAMFQNKILYANIVNDKSCCWYTSAISRTDPFADLSEVSVNFLSGYEPIVVDPQNPVQPAPPKDDIRLPMSHRIGQGGKRVAKFPVALVYAVIVPIGILCFLLNSLLQTALSFRRIRIHSNQEEWHDYTSLPLLAEEIQEVADSVFEEIHHELEPDHLPPGSEEQSAGDLGNEGRLTDSMMGIDNKVVEPAVTAVAEEKPEKEGKRQMESPTLALHPLQFRMIHNLDSLEFRKFPVWIHGDRHTHAAIIVRKPNEKRWKEGRVVVKHWVNECFDV